MSVIRQRSLLYQIEQLVTYFKYVTSSDLSSALHVRSQHLMELVIEFKENQSHLEESSPHEIDRQRELSKQVEERYEYCISKTKTINTQRIFNEQQQQINHSSQSNSPWEFSLNQQEHQVSRKSASIRANIRPEKVKQEKTELFFGSAAKAKAFYSARRATREQSSFKDNASRAVNQRLQTSEISHQDITTKELSSTKFTSIGKQTIHQIEPQATNTFGMFGSSQTKEFIRTFGTSSNPEFCKFRSHSVNKQTVMNASNQLSQTQS